MGYPQSGGLLTHSQVGSVLTVGLLTVGWAIQSGGLPAVIRWAAHSWVGYPQSGGLPAVIGWAAHSQVIYSQMGYSHSSTHRWATHSQVGYSQLGGLLIVRLSRHSLMGSGYLLTVR